MAQPKPPSKSSAKPSAPDPRPAGPVDDVLNQSGPFEDRDLFSQDLPLAEAIRVFGADWGRDHLARTGRLTGSARVQALARQANRHPPELLTHDRFGNRLDIVDYHPAYHELMGLILGSETHSFGWTHDRPGAQVIRAGLSYLWNQAENGVCCPTSMTFAAIPALRQDDTLLAEWGPLVTSSRYDPRPIPPKGKQGLTVGMAMTEKQGGSDLRATMTVARPEGGRRGPGAPYILDGHKWFFSAPMSDLILTVAQTETGLSCFLATGWLPDGRRNGLRLQRLKDKCGNRANASSEVELAGLHAVMLGEEGHGIRTILGMAQATRFDIASASAGLMRQALTQALHHTANRRAFQRRLSDLPVMQAVLADLAVESEAMMWMAMRLAAALDRSGRQTDEALFFRIATPVAKYWSCKRAPAFVAEALECHGGNGYVADHLMERLYREAPLNGIWEGSGNVICLDVLRSMERTPETVDAYLSEIASARGVNAAFDAFAGGLPDLVRQALAEPSLARRLVERMALALQGSLLLRHSSPAVAQAFCATRLGGDWGQAFGTLPPGLDCGAILERARIA